MYASAGRESIHWFLLMQCFEFENQSFQNTVNQYFQIIMIIAFLSSVNSLSRNIVGRLSSFMWVVGGVGAAHQHIWNFSVTILLVKNTVMNHDFTIQRVLQFHYFWIEPRTTLSSMPNIPDLCVNFTNTVECLQKIEYVQSRHACDLI